MVTPASSDRGRLRASHADREQVVDALKAAFVQGRLTQDELDARVGQALAARTYADLAALTADLPALTADLPALTADLPAEPDRTPAAAPSPAPAPAQPHNRPAKKAVKVGAVAIGAIVLVTSVTAGIIGQPVAAVVIPIIAVLFTVFPAAFVAGLIALVLKAESWHRNRSRGQLPPGPASGADGADGQAFPRPPATDPARPRPRRPPGSLAVGHAG